jgi:hypothetical protein
MCVFCAAIPVAATTGISLNGKQKEVQRKAEMAGAAKPPAKPIMQITAGLVVVLMIGSVTYHTLTYLP